jgi:poly(3-hydroxybutyrate) depolymerase
MGHCRLDPWAALHAELSSGSSLEVPRLTNSQFASLAFLWPALVAESASEIASAAAREFANLAIGPQPEGSARRPEWTTANRVALELATLRLRDFGTTSAAVPTLICAPFALHGATITDFAPRHSLVAALQGAGLGRVFVTDWRSASSEMRFLSVDSYLADLNVMVDELGSRVNLIGLCQGGWLALIYAARFPEKVAKLVLAGAPIDLAAGNSRLSKLARNTPFAIFRELVELGGGRLLGQHALRFWAPDFPDQDAIRELLQSPHATSSAAFRRLESRFRDWYAATLDLPGAYYLQVVEHLFKENRLAAGRFVALGRNVDLSDLHCPLFLLAARDDDVVASEQIFATERLVDHGRCTVEKATAPSGHLGLFMGKQILSDVWPNIARWLLH